ncbi:MAG: 6-carboxytetrahydropterin synthase [Candidatus Methylomirabilales bacterium]
MAERGAPGGLPVVEVTRRYRFSAAHRMHNPRFSAEENARLYGRCNHVSGHGHTYRLAVTLRGPVRPATGRLPEDEALDRVVEERVLARLDQGNLDEVIGPRDGPTSTSEALLLFCWRLLAPCFPPGRLRCLRLEETPNNWFELDAESVSAAHGMAGNDMAGTEDEEQA